MRVGTQYWIKRRNNVFIDVVEHLWCAKKMSREVESCLLVQFISLMRYFWHKPLSFWLQPWIFHEIALGIVAIEMTNSFLRCMLNKISYKFKQLNLYFYLILTSDANLIFIEKLTKNCIDFLHTPYASQHLNKKSTQQ